MDYKKIAVMLVYAAIIFGLPWLTMVGWTGLFTYPFLLLFELIFTPLVLFSYFRNPASIRGLLFLLLVYILACLTWIDGGDGDIFMGVENFYSYLKGVDHLKFIPRNGEYFPGYTAYFSWGAFGIFVLGNFVFLKAYRPQNS